MRSRVSEQTTTLPQQQRGAGFPLKTVRHSIDQPNGAAPRSAFPVPRSRLEWRCAAIGVRSGRASRAGRHKRPKRPACPDPSGHAVQGGAFGFFSCRAASGVRIVWLLAETNLSHLVSSRLSLEHGQGPRLRARAYAPSVALSTSPECESQESLLWTCNRVAFASHAADDCHPLFCTAVSCFDVKIVHPRSST